MAKPYTLGGMTFRTQKLLSEYLSKLLNSYEFDEPIHEHTVLRDLLELHPSSQVKKGAGVECFYVSIAPGGIGRCFYILRVDGTSTDFSFKKCLTPPNSSAWTKRVFRQEINDQIVLFRNKEEHRLFVRILPSWSDMLEPIMAKCPVLGIYCTERDMVVDHTPPTTFNLLLESFLKQEKLDIADVICISHDQSRPELQDSKLARRWRLFHQEHAVLRLISIEAHKKVHSKRTAAELVE